MTAAYEHAVIHSIAGASMMMQTANSQKTLGKASSKDSRPGTNLGGFLEQLDQLSEQGWETVNVDLHDHCWTVLLRRRLGPPKTKPPDP